MVSKLLGFAMTVRLWYMAGGHSLEFMVWLLAIVLVAVVETVEKGAYNG